MSRANRNWHSRGRRGVTLIEVLVVMSVMVILLSLATPSFSRTVEQSHADLAGANLRAIWNAQRFYWLEYRTYAASLTDLQTEGLIDTSLITNSNRYTIAVDSASDSAFSASATRSGSAIWSGSFTIDETGALGGTVVAAGKADVTPGFQ